MLTLRGFLKYYSDLHVLIRDGNENILHPNNREEIMFFNKVLSNKCDEHGFYNCDNAYYYYDTKVMIEDNSLYIVEILTDVTNFEMSNIIAMTDVTTNLSGRRLTYDRFNSLINDAIALNEPFACIMGDADLFKRINDTHGHICGDEILKEIGMILINNTRHRNMRAKHSFRGQDIVGRVGGEEFLIVLNNLSLAAVYNVIDRIRKEIEKRVINYDNKPVNLCTMSFGIHYVNKNELNSYKEISESEIEKIRDNIIRKSDQALYQSKAKGRNCISVYGINNQQELVDAIFTRQLKKRE